MLSILKELATNKANSLRSYLQIVQLNFEVFKDLIISIINYTLKKIKKEWYTLKLAL